MAKNDFEMVLGEVELVEGTKRLVLTFQTYHSRDFLNLREWVPVAGEWRPTKKGVVFSSDFLPEVLALLEKTPARRDKEQTRAKIKL